MFQKFGLWGGNLLEIFNFRTHNVCPVITDQ